MKDSANESTKYTYDSLNRISKTEDKLGTISYTYDENGNITDVTEQANAFAAKKTIHRDFDSLNRITKYTDYKGREIHYAYDTLGNMIVLTYPGGEKVRYEYQADGNPTRMESKSGGTSYYTDYTYDTYGRLKTITRPDGTVETREYNPAGQLVRQADKKNGVILQDNYYTYNVFGEVIEKHTANEADTSSLTAVSMTYDGANRLKTYNGEDVQYDKKGNMTYGPVNGVMQELTYDCRNRLISAGGVTYTYDAENTRIASIKDNLTTEYLTDTGGSLSRLLVAYEPDNTETKYYYGAEGLSSQYNTGTKEQFFYHFDNIGSTTMITDPAGKVIERFAYGTYGELLSSTKKKIRFLFNGAYGVTTDENGLYYMRARYYNPDIKRFINQDIKVGDIGNSQSLNRYAYCEGNPVSLIDPFGLSPQGTQTQEQEPVSRFKTLHTILGIAGLTSILVEVPWVAAAGIICDLIDAGLYFYEGDNAHGWLSVVSAIPMAGDLCGLVKQGDKIKTGIQTVGNIVRTILKMHATASTASKALDALGDAKIAKAVNGGKVNGEVVKNYLIAGGMLTLSYLSGKSLVKDVGGFAKAADATFKTNRQIVTDSASGKKIAYGGVSACFVAGTKVKTSDGNRNIEDIKEGDYVLAENPETGEQDYKKVVRTFIREKDVIVHVKVGKEEIETTLEHPFFVEDIGFVSAGELKKGDIIRTSDGRNLPVEDIEIEELKEPVLVYNFEVEDYHTYYVSETGVLVHNQCPNRVGQWDIGGRNAAGVVTGGENLSDVSRMMRGTGGNIGVIPKEIGDKLRGKTFKNFDEFRSALWTEIGNSKYANEFSVGNRTLMKKGNAPFAVPEQWSGKTGKYAIHHIKPIYAGGGVYDLDNIVIVTPRMHLDILDRGYHFNK